MLFRSAFLFKILILLSLTCNCQQTENIIPPSPDAAALGMYGNLPVSTYTGIPDINVPFYNFSFRDISFPIAISYHASGVKVEQDASWVGLGWTLNIGGVITRTIKGEDDMQFADDGISNLGAFYYRGFPYDPGPEVSNFNGMLCNGQVDAEPDMFYFNFLGKSGSFVLEKGQDFNSNTIRGTLVSTEKTSVVYSKNAREWQISTADGFKYYFKIQELSEVVHGTGSYGKGIEFAVYDFLNDGFSFDKISVSSWYLDRIVSPTGAEVQFVYDTFDEQLNGVVTGRKLSRYGGATFSTSDMRVHVLGVNIPYEDCTLPSQATSIVKNFSSNVYLKEVRWPQGKIVLQKSDREDIMPASLGMGAPSYIYPDPFYMNWIDQCPQKLDAISIRNNADQEIKKMEFEYEYFNPSYSGIDAYKFKRLKLKKVRECGSGGMCMPYHEFFYDEKFALPSKYSNAQDFWGYYNGKENNISKIPYGTFLTNANEFHYIGDSDRQPDGTYLTLGTLNKIIYPTGGYTELQFEPHDYYQ